MKVLIYAGETTEVKQEYAAATDESFVRKLEKVVSSYLETEGCIPCAAADVEISLTFMNVEEMAAINREYRETEGPTDVLSFPLWEAEDGTFTPPSDWEVLPLGDIMVCPEVVSKNAVENGNTFIEETALVVFHGVLHLTGYDHDTEERRKVMWEKQDAMVHSLFAPDGGLQ